MLLNCSSNWIRNVKIHLNCFKMHLIFCDLQRQEDRLSLSPYCQSVKNVNAGWEIKKPRFKKEKNVASLSLMYLSPSPAFFLTTKCRRGLLQHNTVAPTCSQKQNGPPNRRYRRLYRVHYHQCHHDCTQIYHHNSTLISVVSARREYIGVFVLGPV